jgi:hypothetical protein
MQGASRLGLGSWFLGDKDSQEILSGVFQMEYRGRMVDSRSILQHRIIDPVSTSQDHDSYRSVSH